MPRTFPHNYAQGRMKSVESRASGISAEDAQRRDALLLKLLRTPPQPRPKRERGKDNPAQALIGKKKTRLGKLGLQPNAIRQNGDND